MMDAYIFQADLYCHKCGAELQGFYSARRHEDDSDIYPQGPYPDGGGEADVPQHCANCGTFLENPLTDDGRAYVRECMAGPDGDSAHVEEWTHFYNIELEMDED